MGKTKPKFIASILAAVLSAAFLAAPSMAADERVGTFVALKGKTVINRGSKSITANRKDPVLLKDIVVTDKRTRVKMLFIDESMLTLGPNSKASIQQFVYSKEGGGASIFNLLDGAMRTVVGKTAFEVHTSTSVAAARGTVIDFKVGNEKGLPFTKITCLEGKVLVKSADPGIKDELFLNAGQEMTVLQGRPLPPPRPAEMLKKRREEAKRKDNKNESSEGTGEGEGGSSFGSDSVGGDSALPPIEQEPALPVTTPVNIDIKFP